MIDQEGHAGIRWYSIGVIAPTKSNYSLFYIVGFQKVNCVVLIQIICSVRNSVWIVGQTVWPSNYCGCKTLSHNYRRISATKYICHFYWPSYIDMTVIMIKNTPWSELWWTDFICNCLSDNCSRIDNPIQPHKLKVLILLPRRKARHHIELHFSVSFLDPLELPNASGSWYF